MVGEMSRLVLRNPLMIRRWRHHHDDVCRVLTPTTRIMTTNRRIHIASSVNNNNNRRLSLNLYRQLLRWCDGMDEMAPLSHHIPPLYLQAPNLINMDSLRELRTAREGVINRGESLQPSSSAVSPQSLLTPNIVIVDKGDESASSSSSSSLTVPIATVKDARNLFRAIFRMNARTTDPTFVKEQVSLAFDGIRTLNEMTKGFNHMRSLRESHMDRDGVKYRVGQVVQLLDGTHIGNRVGMKRNNNMQPRGVIVGWTNKKVDGTSDPQKWQNPIVSTTTTNDDDTDKQPSSSTTTASTSSSSSSSSNKTSLTEKSYQSTVPYDHVRYEVMLDGGDYMQLYGDSVTMRSGRMDGTNTEVYQSDLKLVEDPDLFRIRGPLGMGNNRFERFDPVSNSFVLGPSMAYLYPLDSLKAWESWQNPADPAGRDIIRGIQDMATILRGTILDHRQSVPSDKKLDVLDLYLERLTKLSKGDVLSPEERLTMVGGDSGRTQRLMKSHLQTLMDISLEIGVHLWKRRTSNESQRKVQFSLGEVVQHKKYGFRGVVVAWDPHPAYEVTHWDGLQHIDKPDQYPFYHVIPDPFDSVAVFGGERPWRYVCEANLECCPEGRRGIDVDLEPEWTYDSTRGEFLPPDLIKFRHGCDLEDYGVTQRCLEEIRNLIAALYIAARDSVPSGNADIDVVANRLSMKNMYELLKNAEDADTANTISLSLKEFWKAHCDQEIRHLFDTAEHHVMYGKVELALSLFANIVDHDVGYAEAWNKASACEFMIGNLDASMAAAERTLQLLPHHFLALNGLGLVCHEKKDLRAAVENFRKSMALDPWSPIAPRLSACLSTLERWDKTSLKLDRGKDSKAD